MLDGARGRADVALVEVVEAGPADSVFEAPREPYTKALMAAAFELETVEPQAVRM